MLCRVDRARACTGGSPRLTRVPAEGPRVASASPGALSRPAARCSMNSGVYRRPVRRRVVPSVWPPPSPGRMPLPSPGPTRSNEMSTPEFLAFAIASTAGSGPGRHEPADHHRARMRSPARRSEATPSGAWIAGWTSSVWPSSVGFRGQFPGRIACELLSCAQLPNSHRDTASGRFREVGFRFALALGRPSNVLC